MFVVEPFVKHPRGRWHSEVLGSWRHQWRNELKVNRMLLTDRPPVATPRLLDLHRGTNTFVFEWIDGEPLGPKFPFELDPDDAIDLTLRLDRYRPRRRWHRRFPLERRMRLHVRDGLIAPTDADLVVATVASTRWHFAHGDVTARNLMRASDQRLYLVDWEWAGLHPPEFDLAFLWFSLIDATGARTRVEEAITDRRVFLANAAAITLLHLQMWRERAAVPRFVENHERSLRASLDELRG